MKTILALVCAAAGLCAQPVFPGAAAVDDQIEDAVQSGLIPGAVLVVGHDGAVVYRKAYGDRALIPQREPMTVDTIFDAASLTKVIATTPSLMKLFEQGKLRIDDPVTRYLPQFQGGKSDIEIRDLMTHFSGLRPDLDLNPAWSGYETGIHRALIDKPVRPPGLRFVYSDINFILLGEIVHRLSGEMLSDYARENIFKPLGMNESQFQPPGSLIPRIAPTEIDPDTGKPLRGAVHDDTSRYMGGVAGHAGLFTTADDLAKFAQMMVDRGALPDGRRLFSAATVEKFTSPASPADQPILRGLGWDIDSPYSSNRGELFPIGSYGHTGFTGTSVWIDPTSRTYVILLTNVVHPHRGKSLSSFRSKVATIVAASYGIAAPGVRLTGYNETITGPGVHRDVEHQGDVMTGLDVLAEQHFTPLAGKRIGLLTNHTGLSRDGKRNVDVMLAAGVKIVALLSPEHGITGVEDKQNVANSKDAATGLPVISLYQSDARRPTASMPNDLDALVFDIHDVGARFYTYSCTMLFAMKEAARRHLPFYVLDRPNPITGVHIEGPILDKDLESPVGCMEIPLRHGMTIGELAKWANGEQHIGADLHVVAMRGWNRGDWFDETGLSWVNLSPNMRSLNAALLYPGIAMLEFSTNYSVGRGTDAPFEQVGAEWIRGRALAALLNSRYIPGVRVYPTRFTPGASNFAGRSIEGVRFIVTDRERFDSTRLGLEVASALEKLYPGRIQWDVDRFLIGNHETIDALNAGVDPRTIVPQLEERLAPFAEQREKYLIYR
jgi:uncharacterized protein YbbC (DUF1343 family)/CubicO group peptidase (beta-lactamase class C family)